MDLVLYCWLSSPSINVELGSNPARLMTTCVHVPCYLPSSVLGSETRSSNDEVFASQFGLSCSSSLRLAGALFRLMNCNQCSSTDWRSSRNILWTPFFDRVLLVIIILRCTLGMFWLRIINLGLILNVFIFCQNCNWKLTFDVFFSQLLQQAFQGTSSGLGGGGLNNLQQLSGLNSVGVQQLAALAAMQATNNTTTATGA